MNQTLPAEKRLSAPAPQRAPAPPPAAGGAMADALRRAGLVADKRGRG